MRLAVGQPRLGAHLRAALAVADQHVAGHECGVLGHPVDDLRGAGGAARLDPPGSSSPIAKGSVTTPARRAIAALPLFGAQIRVVALAHRGGAPRVPEDGDEDVDRPFALDVAVERLPERGLVVRRDERIDEGHPILRVDERAADVLVHSSWYAVQRQRPGAISSTSTAEL